VPATINAVNTTPASNQSLYRCIDPSKLDVSAARACRGSASR
jgi:hypothetical protein